MKKITKKESERFVKTVKEIILQLGGKLVDKDPKLSVLRYPYVIDTKAGKLGLSVYDESGGEVFSVYGMFEEHEKAKKLGLDSNPYSGKLNFHSFDELECLEKFEKTLKAIV